MTLEVAKKVGQGGDQGAEDEPEQVQDRGGGGRRGREVCHYHPVHSGDPALLSLAVTIIAVMFRRTYSEHDDIRVGVDNVDEHQPWTARSADS